MHIIQKRLLDLIAHNENFGSLSLRKMAEMIDAEGKPQTAKYHLQKLEEGGFIQMNLAEGIVKLVKRGRDKVVPGPLYSLPVIGMANCGPATIFAEQNIEQYLKVSSKMLPKSKGDLFALIADGPSMNKAEVEPGKTIESGDFVLVDSGQKTFKDGDIVVAIIDGLATIKRFRGDKTNGIITLEADSTEKYLPIFIHEGDDFILNGKVVGIIKAN